MKDYYLVNPNDLLHYGTPKHSGRYPYGSGERPYQGEKKKLTKKDVATVIGVASLTSVAVLGSAFLTTFLVSPAAAGGVSIASGIAIQNAGMAYLRKKGIINAQEDKRSISAAVERGMKKYEEEHKQ